MCVCVWAYARTCYKYMVLYMNLRVYICMHLFISVRLYIYIYICIFLCVYYVAAFVCIHFHLTGYQRAQFVRRALHYTSGSRKFLRQSAQSPRGSVYVKMIYCCDSDNIYIYIYILLFKKFHLLWNIVKYLLIANLQKDKFSHLHSKHVYFVLAKFKPHVKSHSQHTCLNSEAFTIRNCHKGIVSFVDRRAWYKKKVLWFFHAKEKGVYLSDKP